MLAPRSSEDYQGNLSARRRRSRFGLARVGNGSSAEQRSLIEFMHVRASISIAGRALGGGGDGNVLARATRQALTACDDMEPS